MKTSLPLKFTSLGALLRWKSLLLFVTVLTIPAQAQTTWSWAVNNGGNWNNPDNWDPDTSVPNGAGATTNLDFDISADRTVTLDVATTLGVLNIGDPNASHRYILSGSESLTFNNGANPAELNFLSGAENSVQAPIILTGNLTISNASSSQQFLSTSFGSTTAGVKTITFNSSNTGTLRIGNSAFLTNPTEGSINLVVDSAASQVRFGAVDRSAFTGNITLNQGTLVLDTGGQPALLGAGHLYLNGGTLGTSGTSTRAFSTTYTIGGDIALHNTAGAGNNLILSGTGNLGGAARTLTVTSEGGAVVLSGTVTNGGIIKEGSGILNMSNSGTKDYAGGTVINEGTLQFTGSSNNVFSTPATAHITINNGAAMTGASSAGQQVGDVILNNGTISGGFTLTSVSSFTVSQGTVSSVLAGNSATLTKTGSGTVTLNSANTYQGATTISAGTLLINGSTHANSTVTVNGGVLGGTGTIHGVVTVNNTGRLAPGNSPGALTVNNNVTINGGGTLSMEINGPTAGTGYDQLAFIGSNRSFNLFDSNNLELSLNYTPTVGQIYFLTTGATSLNGEFNALNGVATSLGQGDVFTLSGTTFSISYTGDADSNIFQSAGNDLALLTLAVIPEPGTGFLLGLAALYFLSRRRNRSTDAVSGS